MFPEYPALEAHYLLLQRWNKALNLTRIDSIDRNYGESIFLARHLPAGPLNICDIGSGAGFPGFPVAAVRPECHVTLIESHQRKAVFLKEASRSQPNITVLAKRAEEVQATFDFAISRAVSAKDLAFILQLAPNVALLAGEDTPCIPGISWDPPIPLPDSLNRYLWIGRGSVSRETGFRST